MSKLILLLNQISSGQNKIGYFFSSSLLLHEERCTLSDVIDHLFPQDPVLCNGDDSFQWGVNEIQIYPHSFQPWWSRPATPQISLRLYVLWATRTPPRIRHICDQKTIYGCQNLPASGQRDPGEREAPSLNDYGQRLRTGSSLDFHVGDEIRPPDVAYTPKTFLAKGSNSPFFALRQCPCFRSIKKHWNQVCVVQSECCPEGYISGLPDIFLQAAEHATNHLPSSSDLQTVAEGFMG